MAVATMLPHDLHLGMAQGQGLLAQTVARGVVDNMELMLSDLQGIMGDIQSLVAHIDSVSCRSGRRARRGRRQEGQDEQEQENEENIECQGRATGILGQSDKDKVPKSGGSTSSHCIQKPSCSESPRNISLVSDSGELERHGQGAVFKRPKNRKTGQQKMSKRFSDSVLQDASNNFASGHLGTRNNQSATCKKRASAWISRPSTILDTLPNQARETDRKEQKQGDHYHGAIRQFEIPRDIEIHLTQSKDSIEEPWVSLGSSPARRPIYRHHTRDDSLASRGEYDLETLEARLGNRADFSDGEQSGLSLEDSPHRLRHLSKTKRNVIPSSGSIAIVHPILKVESNANSEEKQPDMYDDIEYYGRHRVCKAAFSPKQAYQISVAGQINNIPVPDEYEVPVMKGFKDNESMKQSRQTYVYNKAFIPVTPTEQNSLSTLRKCVGSGSLSGSNKHVNHENVCVLNREFVQPTQSSNHSSLPNSPKAKRSTTVRVGFDFDTFDSNQNRLQSRPIYARIEGSPASTRSSSSTVRKPIAHHYYYSIDSDLDSDIMPECLDPRGLTPDLDWSYLNLIGGDIIGNLIRVEGKDTIDNSCEMPVTLFRAQQPFDIPQRSPTDTTTVPFYHVLASKHSSTPSDGSSGNKEATSDGYEEPTASLLTCDGSNDPHEYCGCYEANLDSVLENVAGFETFEEALESLTCDDILNETYINFDDQFEEDDWDVGLDSEDANGFSIDFPLMYLEDSADAGLSDFLSEKSFDIHTVSSSRSVNRPCVLSLSRKLIPNTLETKARDANNSRHLNKRKISPDNTPGQDFVKHEKTIPSQNLCCVSLSLNNNAGDDENAASSPWIKSSLDSLAEELQPDDKTSPILGDDGSPELMTISYDISCRAVASDSPMSLCSTDTADTSEISDRFVTSSEGDDLFTSYDESYFLLSPASPSSFAVDNAGTNRSFGRTKASELTQQFLMSLRDIYERHRGSADGVSTSVSGNDEETGGKINKSRDSSSSVLSSNNSSTITGSASTATDATLTDDNTADDNSQLSADPGSNDANSDEVDSNSYNGDTLRSGGYNRNVNTWTAYAVVHVQADEVSDGTSSDVIFNDNILGSMYSMTGSHLSNDNADGTTNNHNSLF